MRVHGWGALGIVPAFGVDTLAVAVGLGAAGMADRRRLAVVFAAFEGAMPVIGALAGAALGRLLALYAVWGAAALLCVLGAREALEGWRELHEEEDDEEPGERAGRMARLGTTWGLLAAGIGISTDELGAGFAAGAARMPLSILVPALALQAGLLTYAGLHAGTGLRRLVGRYGELLAGLALVAVGIGVAVTAAR